MATSATTTLTTVILPPPTERASLGYDLAPTAPTGSRHPDCESSESGWADAPILRDEGAIRCPQLSYALSPEGLYAAAKECYKGTNWKASVATFQLNAMERCIKLSHELTAGTYKPRPPKRFILTRPKRRECLSVGIRDRVYQRSLCDNVVYPAMIKSLIPANCACQKGKGTDYARQRLVKMLKRWHYHHGTDGYVLQMDIRGYYPNMRHDVALNAFNRYLDPETYKRVRAILAYQYAGEVGFVPGSQLIQIAGIAVLDGLDHYIKEQLHVKPYVRYMDDMLCLGTREQLEHIKCAVADYLEQLGMDLHTTKTHIQPISNPIPWLGFTYTLKPSGFVLVRCKPSKIRDSRRRFARFVKSVKGGQMPLAKADEVAGITIRHLRKNCSGRADPAKLERYWNDITKELRHVN